MLHKLKRSLYFVVARYFRLFASLKLRRWHPKIIVVTGSAGKTTLLHLLEAQFGDEAHYSHHANSSYGIAFDILGLPGVTRSRLDWLKLAVLAPVRTFTAVHPQKLYVAEVDTDRPGEGGFLASLLKPDITLWVSLLHTHAAQFDRLVATGRFRSAEDAIAHDYGDVIAATRELVIFDGDNPAMVEQAKRTQAKLIPVRRQDLKSYRLVAGGSQFDLKGGRTYRLPAIVPEATYAQVAMVDKLFDYLKRQPDERYARFELPPGRSNLFKGIKNTTLIDSTYNNSNVGSLTAVIELLTNYPATRKWAVIGDILEQGLNEEREHRKLADVLNKTDFEELILVGPRLQATTEPALSTALHERTVIHSFTRPTEARDYLLEHLKGGEVILFKGVRFLEGVVEALLADKRDAAKLPRREAMMAKWRKRWGL